MVSGRANSRISGNYRPFSGHCRARFALPKRLLFRRRTTPDAAKPRLPPSDGRGLWQAMFLCVSDPGRGEWSDSGSDRAAGHFVSNFPGIAAHGRIQATARGRLASQSVTFPVRALNPPKKRQNMPIRPGFRAISYRFDLQISNLSWSDPPIMAAVFCSRVPRSAGLSSAICTRRCCFFRVPRFRSAPFRRRR